MGYVRQSHRARSTGTVVEVLDADHDQSVFDSDEGGRWVTYCVDHDSFVQHLTLALATAHASDPEGWCEPCMAVRLDRGHLTVQQVIEATNPHGYAVPDRATGIEWVGHGHVDPIPVVEALLADEQALDAIDSDQLFRWDYTGRNDAPELSTAGYTVSTYPRDVAPF
jgi:hypothetical protein